VLDELPLDGSMQVVPPWRAGGGVLETTHKDMPALRRLQHPTGEDAWALSGKNMFRKIVAYILNLRL
jgi:hypothetical protein